MWDYIIHALLSRYVMLLVTKTIFLLLSQLDLLMTDCQPVFVWVSVDWKAKRMYSLDGKVKHDEYELILTHSSQCVRVCKCLCVLERGYGGTVDEMRYVDKASIFLYQMICTSDSRHFLSGTFLVTEDWALSDSGHKQTHPMKPQVNKPHIHTYMCMCVHAHTDTHIHTCKYTFTRMCKNSMNWCMCIFQTDWHLEKQNTRTHLYASSGWNVRPRAGVNTLSINLQALPKKVKTITMLRVSNQNGIVLLYIMLAIHHSGWKPSISSAAEITRRLYCRIDFMEREWACCKWTKDQWPGLETNLYIDLGRTKQVTTHAPTHTHIHIHTNIHSLVHIHTHTHTHSKAHTCLRTHMHAHTHIHTRTQAYTHTEPNTNIKRRIG